MSPVRVTIRPSQGCAYRIGDPLTSSRGDIDPKLMGARSQLIVQGEGGTD
jgi:hypothetical protein